MLMIWKRLKKSTPEQEEEYQKQLQEAGVTPREKLVMVLTAYVVILLPCLLILLGMCAVVLWVMGLL